MLLGMLAATVEVQRVVCTVICEATACDAQAWFMGRVGCHWRVTECDFTVICFFSTEFNV